MSSGKDATINPATAIRSIITTTNASLLTVVLLFILKKTINKQKAVWGSYVPEPNLHSEFDTFLPESSKSNINYTN